MPDYGYPEADFLPFRHDNAEPQSAAGALLKVRSNIACHFPHKQIPASPGYRRAAAAQERGEDYYKEADHMVQSRTPSSNIHPCSRRQMTLSHRHSFNFASLKTN